MLKERTGGVAEAGDLFNVAGLFFTRCPPVWRHGSEI